MEPQTVAFGLADGSGDASHGAAVAVSAFVSSSKMFLRPGPPLGMRMGGGGMYSAVRGERRPSGSGRVTLPESVLRESQCIAIIGERRRCASVIIGEREP